MLFIEESILEPVTLMAAVAYMEWILVMIKDTVKI